LYRCTKGTGDKIADEKIFDVWQNVHVGGAPFSVKQDAKMWSVLTMVGRLCTS
jgi:hypothetical protein